MANICSVDFNLIFNSVKAKENFVKEFSLKIAQADLRKEGIELVKNSKWIFDPHLFDTENDKSLLLAGWVKWSIEHETIRKFAEQYIEKMEIVSFECFYEETGNMLYGKYFYSNGELMDYFIDKSNPVWSNTEYEDDNYYDSLDTALCNEAVINCVA